MKAEELTSFSQEVKSIHVAIMADLSQLLQRTNVNHEGLLALLLQSRKLLIHLNLAHTLNTFFWSIAMTERRSRDSSLLLKNMYESKSFKEKGT